MTLEWCNGELLRKPSFIMPAHNRGLTLGDGLFETILVVKQKPVWLDAHLARMRASCKLLGISYPESEIADGLAALLPLENADLYPHRVLRITVTRGDGGRGLAGGNPTPHVILTINEFDMKLIGAPVTLVTSTIHRNASSIASTHKTLSYIDGVAAAREAESRGADDALMLNTDGFAASSTISNLFLVSRDVLFTPALDQGILPGVTRKVVIEAAQSMGFAIRETQVSTVMLAEAESVFLTNSLRLVRPVTRLDGRAMVDLHSHAVLDFLCTRIGVNLEEESDSDGYFGWQT